MSPLTPPHNSPPTTLFLPAPQAHHLLSQAHPSFSPCHPRIPSQLPHVVADCMLFCRTPNSNTPGPFPPPYPFLLAPPKYPQPPPYPPIYHKHPSRSPPPSPHHRFPNRSLPAPPNCHSAPPLPRRTLPFITPPTPSPRRFPNKGWCAVRVLLGLLFYFWVLSAIPWTWATGPPTARRNPQFFRGRLSSQLSVNHLTAVSLLMYGGQLHYFFGGDCPPTMLVHSVAFLAAGGFARKEGRALVGMENDDPCTVPGIPWLLTTVCLGDL